ncbi:thiolase family protein [Membranicola marinus]|uniref:acetyl-CoA C-acyltransferase n=1 Tax=Membranihabitans marinus TaxID=1227546 RepID=A0A953HT56_9BACT|nr:thiolase family protein [Membranihabitans marinus]MBY5957438.1 thiolase family protein [Membranihabitans marinus]
MEAYIIKCYRTAVGKAPRGVFRFTRPEDLAVAVINRIMDEVPGLEASEVDDVLVGCANPMGEQGLQIGRRISLEALGEKVPGVTVNRYCGSGLETIAMATAKIRSGMGHVFIAGGAESMSLIPMTGLKMAPKYDVVKNTPDHLVSMGLTAEAVARKYDISREDQDAFALRSHQNAAHAIDKGYFESQIVPFEVHQVYVEEGERKERNYTVDTDEGIRRDTSLEALAKLRPVFTRGGSVTAGNTSQTSDGASFTLVVSEEVVKRLNLTPMARLISCASAGVDPLYMGIGPIAAVPKALDQANMSLDQIDLIELNEAFATQSLAVTRELGFDLDKLNVNGGAIALGHPLGCTGAKLSTQIIHELHRRNGKYGLVTACIGGGQGIAGVFEKM